MHFPCSLPLALTITLEREFPHLLFFRLRRRGIILAPLMGNTFRYADNGRDGGYDGEEEHHLWKWGEVGGGG